MFCLHFKLDPYSASSEDLALYAQFLSRTLTSFSSIGGYISAVKVLFSIMDIPFPEKDIFLHLTLKGLKRILARPVKQARPITPTILLDIYAVLNLRDPVDVTLWCSFVFSFFLMLRSSQLFPRSMANKFVNKIIKRRDIVVRGDSLLVNLYWTKTIQFNERKLVLPLGALPSSPLCPLNAFKLMKIMTPASQDSSAFVLKQQDTLIPIVYTQFHVLFRQLLQRAGYDGSTFSSHSFRRGGATWAFKNNVPEHLIKLQGDWKSDAFRRYLEVDVSDREKVFSAMSKSIK